MEGLATSNANIVKRRTLNSLSDLYVLLNFTFVELAINSSKECALVGVTYLTNGYIAECESCLGRVFI